MDKDGNKLLLEKFHTFCEENPLEFQEEQLRKVEDDIIKPRNGVVSDEYVDFILWTKGLKLQLPTSLPFQIWKVTATDEPEAGRTFSRVRQTAQKRS